jgi:hypothetical protein
MKLLLVMLLACALVGCGGYGSNYNSMNPGGAAPKLSSLNPNNVMHGNAVSITLTGTGFTAASVVYWGMTAIAASSTGYGSTTQLTANITASQTANAGTVMVYVHTGAGNSNSLPFTIN